MSHRNGFGDIVMEIGRYIGASPWSRIRQREALRNLDDRLLSDIGLSREQVLSGGTMMRTAVDVRDAREGDMRFVQEIYAHHVLHGLASFEEEPPGIAEMIGRREGVLKLGLPYLVAEMDGRIVGYSARCWPSSATAPMRARSACTAARGVARSAGSMPSASSSAAGWTPS